MGFWLLFFVFVLVVCLFGGFVFFVCLLVVFACLFVCVSLLVVFGFVWFCLGWGFFGFFVLEKFGLTWETSDGELKYMCLY